MPKLQAQIVVTATHAQALRYWRRYQARPDPKPLIQIFVQGQQAQWTPPI